VGINKTAQNCFRESFILFSIALLVAFISFFLHGQEDQSAVSELTNRSETVQNWLGKFGFFCLI
jgi:S-DNA-T family DNA segregation ATPase FtsK/SpoIIIE